MRALSIACALLMTASSSLAAQQPPTGNWHGVLVTPGARLTFLVTIRADTAGTLAGDLVSLDQVRSGRIPLAAITSTAAKLAFTIPLISASYEGEWSDSAQGWSGMFRQGAALPLVLKRGTPLPTKVVEGLDGTWRATLPRNSANLRLILHVRTSPYGTRANLDSPDLAAMGLGVDHIERTGNAVSFRVPISEVQFTGSFEERTRTIVGTWTRPDAPPAEVKFVRDSAPPPRLVRTQWPITARGYQAHDVTFANPTDSRVTLAGTLTVPDGRGRFPAVVLISGSGAQDRDETLFGHKPFAVLADYLTRRGIAVLRYDDRGYAKSTGDHVSATSADFATDANAAVRFLWTRSDVDTTAIGFVGHSEGGMIAPIAAVDNDRVAFLVLLAGPGTRTDQIITSQRRLMFLAQGSTKEEIDRSEPVVLDMIRAVRNGRDSADAASRARAVLTEDALKRIGMPATSREGLVDQFIRPWMRYFLSYDPMSFVPRVRVPVLAINGSLDTQVPSAENLAGLRIALSSNPDATVLELPGLNHLFQTAKTGALGEYDTLAETFAPSAMALIGDWIAKRFVKR